jgi:hypothetical protein
MGRDLHGECSSECLSRIELILLRAVVVCDREVQPA